MCARFYSAALGRFLSADPLVVAPGDPQMLDRYAYVRNNPLRYVDPTGLGLEELTPEQARALVAWGKDLLASGVPRDRLVETMLNKALYLGAIPPTSPRYYLTTTYEGDLLDYPLLQAQPATATSVSLRVAMVPGTGQLVVIYKVKDDAPLGTSLRVTVELNNGDVVEVNIDPVASLLYRIRENPQRDEMRPGPCIPPCGPDTRVLVYDFDVARAGGVPMRVRIEPVSEFSNWRRALPTIDLGLTPVWY